MANPFKKPDYRFPEIAAGIPLESEIDWNTVASGISENINNVLDYRATEKAKLDKAYEDQQKELEGLANTLKAKNANTIITEGVYNAAENLTIKYQMMKDGKIKPRDFNLAQQKIANDFTVSNKFLTDYDTKFTDFTERSKVGENGISKNTKAERSDAESAASFNNLNNKKLIVSGDNMMWAQQNEDGSIDPLNTQTPGQLLHTIYQQTDNIDITKLLTDANKEIGKITLGEAQKAYGRKDVTTVEIKRAETEFFRTNEKGEVINPEADNILDTKVNAMAPDTQSLGVLATENLLNEAGDSFEVTRDINDVLKYAKENPKATNRYVYRGWNSNETRNVFYPEEVYGLSEENNKRRKEIQGDQEKYFKKGLKKLLLASFDASEKPTTQQVQVYKPPTPPKEDLDDKLKKAKILNFGNYLKQYWTGTPAKSRAAFNYLRNEHNRQKGVVKIETQNLVKRNATQADVDAGYATKLGERISLGTFFYEDGTQQTFKGSADNNFTSSFSSIIPADITEIEYRALFGEGTIQPGSTESVISPANLSDIQGDEVITEYIYNDDNEVMDVSKESLVDKLSLSSMTTTPYKNQLGTKLRELTTNDKDPLIMGLSEHIIMQSPVGANNQPKFSGIKVTVGEQDDNGNAKVYMRAGEYVDFFDINKDVNPNAADLKDWYKNFINQAVQKANEGTLFTSSRPTFN